MGVEFDAVVFDAGGVLMVPTPEVFGPLVAEFDGDDSEATIVRAHYVAMHAQDRHSLAEQDWDVYDRAFVMACGVARSAVDDAQVAFRTAMASDVDLWRWPLPASLAVLQRLDAMGVPMAVVSNADGQIEDTLRRVGVCQVGSGELASMVAVVDSAVVGVSKPDPRIFRFALDALGVAPERCLYVGDSIGKDVIGAGNAGMHAVHVDPYDLHRGADHDRISSLEELVRWLA